MIYLDHNATTCLAPEVVDAMLAALRDDYGNASSIHGPGQSARQKLEYSRQTIARAIGAQAREIVFTSGGTESNNLALLGLTRITPLRGGHILTTDIEHPSVLECCRQLEDEGLTVTYIRPDVNGVVDLEAVSCSIRANTILVCIMHANNEVGTVQPIAEIGSLVRQRRELGQQIFFHSDGVQALGKVPVNVEQLGVDTYSMSAHKLFGPKGTGALYIHHNVPLRGIQKGGRQERGRRAGTENVPAALGFARAAMLCSEGEIATIRALRDRFERGISKRLDNVTINGAQAERLPNTSNVHFHGISGESLVIALDLEGIAVSTGSACSSGSLEPSHVLLAMGLDQQEARSCVRFSFGRYNNVAEIDTLIEGVCSTVRRLAKSRRKEMHFAG